MSNVSLPSPAAALKEAFDAAHVAAAGAGLTPDQWLGYGRLMLDVARELREGSRMPPPDFGNPFAGTGGAHRPQLALPIEDDNDGRIFYDASSYADQAADQPETPRGSRNLAETVVLHTDQPMPVRNDGVSIQAMVRRDLEQREKVGIQRYGTPLQAFNGRDALRDAYEEALDLSCYLRQALAERDG